jgi:hypothetical protein
MAVTPAAAVGGVGVGALGVPAADAATPTPLVTFRPPVIKVLRADAGLSSSGRTVRQTCNVVAAG